MCRGNCQPNLCLQAVAEVERRFPAGVPSLEPEADMGVREPGLRKAARRVEAMEVLLEEHPLAAAPDLAERLRALQRKQVSMHWRDACASF